ncbi:OmcA/MtrC family decaheme c-type cytochrome [Thiohalomonas denitrificans]|uniref:Decaheme c-type cytochrome, OmcA/MtrC family n=1 Tax=Thiohalomonas denitrificans TaxID=415747 RepID=A0A1G5QYF2_9GAMM|nr:OmcA/MtrC family decaheme c-type cytochrome [Thiohalomonas denitrificans]SCZ66833.1 decaheme c-type cytochrome, OmcA/MtrC family [Thiohalomonas denitrificans]
MSVRLALQHVHALIAFALILSLTACGGDGEDGADGQPGPPGPSGTASTATALDVQVSSVEIESPPVVEFYIEDQDGMPFTGLTAGDLRFTIAQLKPGANGEPSAWQSYINKTEEAGSVGPGTEDKVQANYESATDGTFVNNGDGSYSYTFATDITNVTSPVAVDYESTRTHRIAMQIEGGAPVTNAVHTWQPSTGMTSGISSRDIVMTESCNECHGKLAFHGGGRIDTRYCVTCHNPGSADANSGNTIDAKVLFHKLHMGANLPSVVAGGTYSIFGYRNSEHDYSDLQFPQDVRNCTKCHDGADSDTPDADNWKTRPSVEACGSCHDDVEFDTGLNHMGGVADNSMCSGCHANGGWAGPVADSHVIPTHVARERFAYNITEASYDASTGTVTANFTITDPSNGDTPYDLTEADWTASNLRLNIAWDSSEYTNTDSGNGVSKAVQIAFLSGGALDAAYHSYDAGTGVHTVTSDPLPAAAQGAGSGSVAIEGYPKADVDGATVNTPITSAVEYFAINDGSAQARRQVVDNAKCLQCHETLSLHGNNRVNDTAICVTCHNPNNTDISVRPAGGGGGLDGKLEESIDFKRMVHAIHATGSKVRENPVLFYGYRGSVHDYSGLRFPGILSNCQTCHDGDTYALPLSGDVSPSVIDTTDAGTDSDSASVDTDPTNDRVITPTAAVCSSCHDKAIAQAHMEHNGALFEATRSQALIAIETCETCHGPGRTADVAVIHGVE